MKPLNQIIANQYDISAWILTALALIFVLQLHLLPAVLAGFLVYELVNMMTTAIAKRFPTKKPSNRAKIMAASILVIIVVSLLALAGAGLVAFFRSDAGSLTALLAKMAQIIEDSRKVLPGWLLEHLPADANTFRQEAAVWLRDHAGQLQVVGKEAGRVTVHIILGMIIGGMLALRDAVKMDDFKPFARALATRADMFGEAFKRVVFAQIRISALNTCFTAIYLLVVLPLMGVQLPLVKTMIAITFVVGLIPVLGNLISNTVIVIVSLSHTLSVAIGSLLFLVVIHKVEYFLNARIVGGQISAKAWEILIAMLAMESLFGLAGVVAAPIYYAYIKSELRAQSLV